MLEKSNCEKTFFEYIAQFIPEETSNATIKTKLAYARFSESVLTSFRLPEDIQIYQLDPAWQSKRRNKGKKIKLSVSVLQYKSTRVFMLYQIYLQHPGQSKKNNKISVQTQTRKNTSELVTITIRFKFH